MDILIGKHGFRSRAEIAKEAIRALLKTYPKELPRFYRINGDATGVSIFDRELTGSDKGVHVSIRPTGIICDFHQTSNCEHVKFALGLSDVQEMIKKRQKEGWKLELPDI
jgi:hypothetical protein